MRWPWLTAGLLLAGPAGAQTDALALKPALSASVSFAALSGDTGATIPPRTPFQISVAITNHAGQDRPAGLNLYGWLRRSEPDGPPCAEAAEAFLRTGRLPVGAVFLNDPLIAMLTEDNSVLLVDPEFSLATANILAAQKLTSRPAAISLDPDGRRLLIPLPDEGRVMAIDIGGGSSQLAQGLDHPKAAIPTPDGGAIILTTAGLIRAPRGPLPDAPGDILDLVAAEGLGLIRGADRVLLFDPTTGAARLDWPIVAGAALILPGPDGPTGVAAVQGDALLIRYLDAPEALRIPLAGSARALAASRDGRFVFAHDPTDGPVQIVDLALSRMVQTSGAEGMPVSEVVLGDSAAYLMLADQSRVGVLDLASLAGRGAAEFREVPLGQARAKGLAAPGLLTSLAPDQGVLAVHQDSRQGYRLHDYAAMGNAPAMSAILLRGGVPRQVIALDRSFREDAEGSFRTIASLPAPGEWELVATTGLGALSFCAPVPVTDPGAPRAVAGRVLAIAAGGDGGIQLRMVDAAGIPVMTQGIVTFAALSGAWRDRAPLQTDAQGLSLAIYDLPPGDSVVATVEAGPTPFDPLLLEATP